MSAIETANTFIPVANEKIPAYFVRPKTPGPHPCIIVVHEIFGVHEYIREVCRKLAEENYCALTIDLYARYGDATKMTDIKAIFADVVSKTRRQQIYKDLDAAFTWLSKEH